VSFALETRKIGTLAIDKHFLAVFEVAVGEIRFCADFLEVFIIVMNTAVNAMGIIVARQEIGFDAFGTGAFLAVFAWAASTNHCGIVFCADRTAFLFWSQRSSRTGRSGRSLRVCRSLRSLRSS
jgi:hypothetical protein